MSQSRSTTRIRISLNSGADRTGSPVGLIGAIALHAAIIIATLFTWEHRLDIAQDMTPIVPVDLVTVADKTNVAPAAPIVPPQPKMEQIPVPQAAPPNIAAQTPPLPQDQSEPAPETKSEPVVKPPPAPAVPKAKPQPHPDTAKSLDAQMAALLNNLAKPSPHPHSGNGTGMTADLKSILYSEMQPCWTVTAIAGAPDPEQLAVSIHLDLNPDGTVAGQPQLAAQSAAAEAGNPYIRALADTALRAIRKCAPYKLPVNRYQDWRSADLSFSPQSFTQ
jgi:outer membrane biosynthesis protein TonB